MDQAASGLLSFGPVNTQGGAVFGHMTAGRDITVYHITQIRQECQSVLDDEHRLQHLPEEIINNLSVLEATAALTEEFARDLQISGTGERGANIREAASECQAALDELKGIVALIKAYNVRDLSPGRQTELSKDLKDLRGRIMSIHSSLSKLSSNRVREDFDRVLKDYVDDQQNAPAPSFTSFYTAESTPYAERKMWSQIRTELQSRGISGESFMQNFPTIAVYLEQTILSVGGISEGSMSDAAVAGAVADNLLFTLSTDTINEKVPWCEEVHDPWAPLLLTLDGGGVRSFSSLLILHQLMKEIRLAEEKFERDAAAEGDAGETCESPDTANVSAVLPDFRPCHYLDSVWGTSTGGIIAIMLGRLRMDVEQATSSFVKTMSKVYNSANSHSRIPLTTKYHHEALETNIKETIMANCKEHLRPSLCHMDLLAWSWEVDKEEPTLDEVAEMPGTPDITICQTVCLTAVDNGNVSEAYLLRSYFLRYAGVPSWVTLYNEGTARLKIWEAARATTAAPFYFEALTVIIDGERHIFKDGGIRENNPTAAAYNEVIAMRGESCDPGLLLSIGSGVRQLDTSARVSKIPDLPGPLGALQRLLGINRVVERAAVFKDLLIKYTDAETTHRAMNSVVHGLNSWYKRLSVSTGLGDVQLDDTIDLNRAGDHWDSRGTAGIIKAATDLELSRDLDLRYDGTAPPKEVIKEIAEKLVRHRRAREFLAINGDAEDRKKWETYMGRDLPGERDFYIDYWTKLEGPDSISLAARGVSNT